MNSDKTIFVTGATGNQGSATAINLAAMGFKVKALVRNTDSSRTEKLNHPGITLVKGNYDDPSSYKDHLKNIDGVFAMFTYLYGTKKEIKHGLSFIDACKEKNVPFILYSSVIGADGGTGIPHWESKNVIEEYIKKSGIPFAIIRPASFFENYFIHDIRKRIKKGTLTMPVKKHVDQQFISAEDAGKIFALVFANKNEYIGKTISIAADQMNLQTAASVFSEVLGKPVKYVQLPGLLTRIFMGKDLYTMFNYINHHDVCYVKNLEELKLKYPFLTPLRDWIKTHSASFTS